MADWVYRPETGYWDSSDESQTARNFPATEDEDLDTGLLDASGKKILKRPRRIKMGFHLG